MDDLRLGLLLVVNGGRSTWVRLSCSAVGIGLCTTVLLLAAAMGPALDARDGRSDTMTPQLVSPWWTTDETPPVGSLSEPGSFAANDYEIPYRQQPVRSTDLSTTAENLSKAQPPPGVDRFPGPGELVVSPSLLDLLGSPDGAQLRPRVAGEIIGSIGPEGLLGPGELRVYRGTTATADIDSNTVATGWGMTIPPLGDPMAVFAPALTVAGTAIVGVPLLIFVWLMSRLGSAASDRRFAVLRLLGASGMQLRRIAAVEALLASVAGLILGLGGFLIVRSGAGLLTVGPAAFYPQDLTPHPAAVLAVVLLVPVLAVAAGWIGSRRVDAEPLAVVREVRTTRARRPGLGLVLLALGALAMIGSLYAGALSTDIQATVLLALSIATLLTAVAVLLPWALQWSVNRLPVTGSAWQLAVRRLQLDPVTPSQVVAGICVVLAGVIAIQPVLTSVSVDNTGGDYGAGVPAYRVFVRNPTPVEFASVIDMIARTEGVTAVSGGVPIGGSVGPPAQPLPSGEIDMTNEFGAFVTTCAAIAVAGCVDGDVYLADNSDLRMLDPQTTALRPGVTVNFGPTFGDDLTWTMPVPSGTVRLDPAVSGFGFASLLITRGALGSGADALLKDITLDLRVKSAEPSSAVADRWRSEMSSMTWRATVATTAEATGSRAQVANSVRTALAVGVGLTMLVAAAGLLVMSIEQLTARRRTLAYTIATGVPRAVITRSLMIGATIPVLVGVGLAVVIGGGLSAFLLTLTQQGGHLPWTSIAAYATAAVSLVVIATLPIALLVPRIVRPEAIRTE
ncbi:FtsX-like permease family protein [Nakamurella sp. GG22]